MPRGVMRQCRAAGGTGAGAGACWAQLVAAILIVIKKVVRLSMRNDFMSQFLGYERDINFNNVFF